MNVRSLLIGAAVLVVLVVAMRAFSPTVETRNANPSGETIVAFGDSLTYGTGAGNGSDYPSHLSRMVGETVINMGVPGETTGDALKRLDSVLENNPRIVIVTLGGNDLKKKVPTNQVFENLKTIVSRIQDRGTLVVIGGIDVPFFGSDFGDAYEELARETGSLLVPNVFDGIITDRSLMSDPIHPNGEGYRLMAEAFYSVISPFVQ